MTHPKPFCQAALRAAFFVTLLGTGVSVLAAPLAKTTALLYSTMPSTAAHRPDMALDGDTKTYFKTVYGMGDGDDFLVLFGQAVPVKSLHIVSGDEDGGDTLTDGFVETSPDGEHYTTAAKFDDSGVADATLGGKPVMAVRIRLNARRGIPSLVIREIKFDSPTKIGPVLLGPGRGFVDISREPDVAPWAARAEKQMESFWADTAALLYSDKFITPNMVNVVYQTGPGTTGVAATGGGVMTVNADWCRKHDEDTGLTVHETAHVVQAMSAYDPVWLIEGIADYIRWVKFEPEHFHPRINFAKATYHDSYQTTATFLAWCERHYDSTLVTKLNRDTRQGTFKIGLFQKYCGKDVDTLWGEFIAAYKADPAGIIATPVAPADRPRILPAVTASTPVDIASAFNTIGIYADGTAIGASGGLDGEGSYYSAALLGPTLTAKGVEFRTGKPGVANVVTCKGDTIRLPAGAFTALYLLGTGIEGGQKEQAVAVTYTDGSTETLVQNFSDWFQPQTFVGEIRGVKMAYRNVGDGSKDPRTFYVYRYGFPLNAAKTVKSVTLPNNPYVKVLAVTLTK
jgi:hypothetical protein